MSIIKLHFHHQTRFGGTEAPPEERGNCDKTCLATLIGYDPHDIPNYQTANGDEWWKWRNRFLNSIGFHIICFGDLLVAPPFGFCIAVGKSPRGDWNHAVLAKVEFGSYKLLHDPHPSGDFLDGSPVQFEFVFRKIDYRSE